MDRPPAVLPRRARIKSLVLSVGILAAAQCAAGDLPRDNETPSLAKLGPRMRFYDVEGTEHGTLLKSMNRRGPQGFHGRATWDVTYTYKFAVDGDRCAVSQFEARMDGDIQMPRWTRREGASADLVARWQRYELALLAHEEGHLAHGHRFAAELNREMLTFPVAQECKALDEAVQAHFAARLKFYGNLDVEYDDRTQHGALTGARF